MTEKKTDEVPAEVFELHPLVLVIAAELKPGEGDEEFAPLEEDKFIELGAAILSYVDEEDPKVELLHVAQSFAAYAVTLRDQHNSGRLAEQIFECIGNEDIVANLEKLAVSADPEKVQQVAQRFTDFTGSKTEKKAPKVGEAKPEGSIDINKLNFPKRM